MDRDDVKRIREKCGLTQQDLADLACVERNTINRYEMGLRKIDGPMKIVLEIIRAVRTNNKPALAKILGRFRVKTDRQRRTKR